MLRTRVLTAVILLPVVLFAIWCFSPLYFSLLVAAFILLGAWEWSSIIGFTLIWLRIGYVLCMGVALFLAMCLPTAVILWVGFAAWIWTTLAIVIYQCTGSAFGFQSPVVRVLLGFLILVPCWISIIYLHSSVYLGPDWVIYVLLITWSADAGAYFSGRRFGRHALVSRVSPKKTWEGFFGGLLLAIAVIAIGSAFAHITWQEHIYLFVWSVLTALFSVIGDLGISLLKRMTGMKDSGRIFPGHGGVLDRIDSVAAAMVVFALGAAYFVF